MGKATGNLHPAEAANPEVLAQRIKRDLLWVAVSVAVAFAAAAATYLLIKPA